MSAYRDGKVALRFELTEAELVPPPSLRVRRIVHRARLVVVGVWCLASAFYFAQWGLVGALESALLACFCVYFDRWMGAKLHVPPHRSEAMRQCEVEADEARFAHSSGVGRASFEWPLLLSWEEDDHAFRVFSEPASYVMVPKRAFPGADAESAFRRLLSSKVGAPGRPSDEGLATAMWASLAVYSGFVTLLVATLLEAALGTFGWIFE